MLAAAGVATAAALAGDKETITAARRGRMDDLAEAAAGWQRRQHAEAEKRLADEAEQRRTRQQAPGPGFRPRMRR